MRHKKWQEKFWAAVERERLLPFEYGRCDCVLFAARIADAISDGGYERRAREAFKWSNEREALRLMARGLQSLVESVMGPMIPWTRLRMGDIALIVDDEGNECIAVHDGTQFIGKVDRGIRVIPFRCVKGGWRVE